MTQKMLEVNGSVVTVGGQPVTYAEWEAACKGLVFFADYGDEDHGGPKAKRADTHPHGSTEHGTGAPNTIAVAPHSDTYTGSLDAIGAVYYTANSPCAGTGASREYLAESCRRIPRDNVPRIHHEMVAYLVSALRSEREYERAQAAAAQ